MFGAHDWKIWAFGLILFGWIIALFWKALLIGVALVFTGISAVRLLLRLFRPRPALITYHVVEPPRITRRRA